MAPPSKFHPRVPMVFTRDWGGFKAGAPVPGMRFFRKRKMLRMGVIAPADVAESAGVDTGSTETETEVDAGEGGSTVETVTAVSAEEGNKGWWVVTFSDGTETNMRRSAVVELGLIDALEVEVEVGL